MSTRRLDRGRTLFLLGLFVGLLIWLIPSVAQKSGSTAQTGGPAVLRGEAALGDWRTDKPGVRRLITTGDLPKPYASPSVDNAPKVVPQPSGAWPEIPAGFKIERIATGLDNPRVVVAAPNGDLFVAESEPGRIKTIRNVGEGKKPEIAVFAAGLDRPFGIAFYPRGANPKFVYVANTGSVVRFTYQNGDLKARANPETIVPDIPSGGRLRGGGHWTRDIAFSTDGRKMFVSVGSRSNVSDDASEQRRADILEYNPDGSGFRIYASGIRNAVGVAIQPTTGQLWASVNERDELGDDLPPDYITHVADGGFYGWPWYYIGPNQDPRHAGKHDELRDKVLVPDVLIQAHSASLAMTFYTGRQFPREYHGDVFAAQHGSWNRNKRTGYKVIRVPMSGSKATGEYEDFVTGFVTPEGQVWGRPVGVAVAKDGSLIFTEDGLNSVWRVSYVGPKKPSVRLQQPASSRIPSEAATVRR